MTKAALLLIFGLVTVGTAIGLNFILEAPEDETAAPVEQAANPSAPGPAGAREASNTAGSPAGTSAAGTDEPAPPSFDVVRINTDGDTVMAGRAEPGAVVEIYDGGKKIGEVTADRRGEWVFVPDTPLPPGSRRLSLMARLKDGGRLASANDVILVVPEQGKDVAGQPSSVPNQPLALKVPRNEEGPVTVLQKPLADPAPGRAGADGTAIALAVEAVDYDDKGKLSVIGKAPAKSQINLYLDNEFLGRSIAGAEGRWFQSPEKLVSPGVYTLRADRIGGDGNVLARVEVHFARSVPLTGVEPGSLVVVRPGHSLWRIARRTYGSGFKYTVIYRANQEQIKNADLIFPGQVFQLPSVN